MITKQSNYSNRIIIETKKTRISQMIVFLLRESKMKRILMALAFAVIIFFGQSVVYAETLSPFGKFEWSDNIVDVFRTLKGIDSLKEININGIERFRNVNALENSDSDLIAGIKETIKQKSKGWMFNEYNKELILKDGKKSLYHVRSFTITANPVILVEIPYKVSFRFKIVPGYILTNPDKAIQTEVDGKEIMFLAQFEIMEFFSQDKNLALKNHQKLYKIIKQKYPVMKDVFGKEWKGQSGGRNHCYEAEDGDYSVGFCPEKEDPGIYYMNSLKSVEESYITHRNNVLSKELKYSDSSSDL